MTTVPTRSEFLASLERTVGTGVGADVPLGALGLESLTLLEWFYALEEAYGVDFDVEILDRLNESTAAELYEALAASLSERSR